tara:strand:+ start:169 stop:462 length:294 start_codon:yes stop_codon:yes gene_type:complete
MYKLPHKTIIEQYDYMNLVQELTHYMWERFLEENDKYREEYVVYDLDNGDTFTSKGEDVFAGIEEDLERIIKTKLQLEYHGNDREWRSKESLLELPF